MCFYTKGSKIRIAFKDIECYKCVSIYPSECVSACEKFRYNYYQIYSNKSKLKLFLKWLFNEDINSEAYHSYIKHNLLTNIKCIIPKGSLYLISDEFHEYCSSSIIIKNPYYD